MEWTDDCFERVVGVKIIDRRLAVYLSKLFDESCYFIKPDKKPKFVKSIIKKMIMCLMQMKMG